MSDTTTTTNTNEAPPPASPVPPAEPPRPASPPARGPVWVAMIVLLALAAGSLVLAYQTRQHLQVLEQDLVRRQQDSHEQATEARTLAREAQDVSRDASAKVALLEARLSEVAVQRTQLEELMQSLSRSREENLLGDVEASLRVALQQVTITGSAEPLVAALRSADERLQRANQPRLEGVRRAIARDLERVSAAGLVDVSGLVIRIDEAVRLIDELPLLSNPAEAVPQAGAAEAQPAAPAPASSADWWRQAGQRAWAEVRSLIRVTRVDRPEAMLVAPEQAFFLRENLKLRLLNARLALLGRQFDTVQADLDAAGQTLERYFDGQSRRVGTVRELLGQVAAQARQTAVPRPDDTFAALAAVSAAR
ncbi:uroporphyrinogen-III C-methyltransferase [Caldimonas thermodepolymerans]|uniref:Uroporphyrin-3 C-methyltransferase n=2 Tax=Caldimonas thermodepolymerans TaxID=215580 RepID=A0AA46DG40_9BURK|nr:uroporphyrinogen-III C-methyltransferase [Caldimonas thermodepolymerans]RDH94961.1 uroporphyrin-3 C-methyltransferase [Caldimonas thermodepolymerans]TCP08924.1 uroporphyrin-3 C-methyltransferase [Caldimonas thermodepolymerans]UZG43566.1 uroporphyrinogen-III C-methyltransferase [Caldimonas thermodepolymerans]UZG47236.1 uroporphyrinogen-III C-methyltransferase [Caldimonas thermodepolymerans]